MKQIFITLFFAGCFLQTAAQFKNIVLDSAQAYEPSVAVNRDDPKNIVASSATGKIYYTTDGGTTWTTTELASAYGVAGNLVLVSDFKGNFFCLHHSLINKKNQIVIQESTDGGKTWTTGALVSSDTTRHAMRPGVAIDRKGNLFVTWIEFDLYPSNDVNCMSRILLSRSSNGKKWSKPMELSQTKGDCQDDDQTVAGAMPAVMGEGQRAFGGWANQGKIFFDRSFDGGGMWLSNDLAIAEQAGGSRMNVPGLKTVTGMPMLLCNNTKRTDLTGALYLMWSDQLRGENDTDVWFTRSLDFGDHWTEPGRVNDDVQGKHQYMPAMALDAETGNIYIVYYDRRNYTNETTDVYLAFSTNAGSSFRNVKINSIPFVADENVSIGSYIAISVHQGVIAPVWTRTHKGKSSVMTTIIRQEELDKLAK